MVAGRNPVVESLRAQVPAMALYVTGRAQQDERVAEAVQLAAGVGIAVLEAGMGELDRLTGGAVHQGVALRVRPYEYAHPDDFTRQPSAGPPLIVALDGVTDPRNLGAVVRSAAATMLRRTPSGTPWRTSGWWSRTHRKARDGN